jgi:hypothetical protein
LVVVPVAFYLLEAAHGRFATVPAANPEPATSH